MFISMSDSKKRTVDLDAIDRRLLIELTRDARTSLRRLAEEMNVSPATLHNRMTRMVQEGMIKSFVALLDYSKLGFALNLPTATVPVLPSTLIMIGPNSKDR